MRHHSLRAVVALQRQNTAGGFPVEGDRDWTFGGGQEECESFVEKVQHRQRGALLTTV